MLIDLAIKHGIPIIPVRFAGGLPLNAADEKLEFPIGFGQQDYYIGAVIEHTELEALPYGDRAKRVLAAINTLGNEGADSPLPADDGFSELVASQTMASTDIQKVLRAALLRLPELGDRMQRLMQALDPAGKPGSAEKIVAKLLG